MNGRDLISIRDMSNAKILGLFELAAEFSSMSRQRLKLAREAILVSLFFEPSTRTRMSFEAAMLRLGGQIITMADPSVSSAVKGETLADTIRIVDSYADVIVLRHPREGAARVAADFAQVPVINAGDGAREHPTQTLLDLFTIYQEKRQLRGVTVALCGDLKYGRTVHSLVQGLARFGARILCVAPPGLELPASLVQEIRTRFNASITESDSLQTAPLGDCDAIYVTRIQRERFADPTDFERVRCTYQVTRDTLSRARQDAIVLHPLPRVDELDFALDGDPRAAYFRQAAFGVPVRMALMAAVLGLRKLPYERIVVDEVDASGKEWRRAPGLPSICENPRCITLVEPAVKPWVMTREDGACRCEYCEAAQEVLCLQPC